MPRLAPLAVSRSPQSRICRALVAVTLVAGVGTTTAAALADPASAAPGHISTTATATADASAPVSTTSPDYATDHFGKPWDYTDSQDVNTSPNGPTLNLTNELVGGGHYSFDVSSNGYFSPVWGGYPGGLYMGREGAAPGNAIDAGRYTHLAFTVTASQRISAGLMWFSCADGALSGGCEGGMPFTIAAGTHSYDLTIANQGYGLPQAWNGTMTGLRFAVSPQAASHLDFEWMSLRPSGLGTTPPPVEPHVVVDAPDAAGETDWASSVTGSAWNFADPSTSFGITNAANLSYAGGELSATNAGPVINDPHVNINLRGKTITNPGTFHRLTVTASYDGPFNLEDKAGGGTMGRIIWQTSIHGNDLIQTKPVVTYDDTNTYTFDLSTPGLNEPSAPNQYPWATSGAITALRWDPNEDRGARRWHITSVSLRSDWTAKGSFAVRWHDTASTAGSTVALYYAPAVTPGTCSGTQIVSGLTESATDSYTWNTASTPDGSYRVCVQTTNAAGQTTAVWSTGPVAVTGPTLSTHTQPGDLAAVQCANTASGHVEVNVATRASAYKAYSGHLITPLAITDPQNWVFRFASYNHSGGRDLYAIHEAGTASGNVEVHVLSEASGYRQWTAHLVTPIAAVDPTQWQLELGPHAGDRNTDLYAIRTAGTSGGSAEVHVLSAASNYKTWLLHTVSALTVAPGADWSFLIGDPGAHGDIIGVLQNAAGGQAEIHTLSAASNYRAFSLHVVTPLAATTATEQFSVSDLNHDGIPDVAVTPFSATGSGGAEVHALSGATNFHDWLLHSATRLGPLSPTAWSLSVLG